MQLLLRGFPQVEAEKTAEGKGRATGEDPRRQLEHAEQQDQHIEHQQGATAAVEQSQQIGQPATADQDLRLGHARITKAQVVVAAQQGKEQQLTEHHHRTTDQRHVQRRRQQVETHGQPEQRHGNAVSGHSHGKTA